jgi:hypothetical protein
MALATGLFNINTGNPAELNVRSFAGQILRRFPNGSAPMFALTSQTGRSKAKQSTHGYFTKVMTFSTLTVNDADGGLAADVAITVVSTAGVTVGMVYHNPATKENIRVSGITSSTVLAVQRGFGRVAAANFAQGATWIQVGTAFEEGSNRPAARRLTTAYVPNYTQIFRNAWALTATAKASMAEMGISNIAENRNDCSMFHSVDIESAIVWGQAMMDTTGNTPVHATQGVLDAMEEYCPENTNAAGATTDYDELVALVEPAFEYSTNLGDSKSRVGFCDKVALKVLNQIGRLSGQIQISTAETSFGMRFTRFEFYKGTINLIEHPLFNGLGRSGTMLVMDMPALKLAYLEGRDTVPENYGVDGKSADNGQDAVGGSLTTELAVELINPYANCYVTGLTAGAA